MLKEEKVIQINQHPVFPDAKSIAQKKYLDAQTPVILATHENDLPKAPESLRMSVIVPSCAEMHNNNFWNMLEYFLKQNPDYFPEFELIFVVNNPAVAVPENNYQAVNFDMANMHTQTRLPLATWHERYRENQYQIRLIKLIQVARQITALSTQENPFSNYDEVVLWILSQLETDFPEPEFALTKREYELLRKALKSNLQLGAIDLSSKNRALNLDKSWDPIGYSRWLGGIVATDRLVAAGPTAIIDYLDADSFPNRDYVETKLAARINGNGYAPFPTIDYLADTMISVITEIPKSIYDLPPKQKYENFVGYIRTHYYTWFINYIFRTYDLAIEKNGVSLGGPQLSVTPQTVTEIAGYAFTGQSTDFTTGTKASTNRKGLLQKIRNGTVFVGNRYSPSSYDGKNAGAFYLNRDTHITTMCQILELDSVLASHQNEKIRNRYLSLRKDHFRREKLQQLFFLSKVQEVIELCFAFWEGHPAGINSELLDYLEQFVSPSEADFLRQNTIVLDYLTEQILPNIGKARISPEDVMEKLHKELPELLYQPPTTEPDYSEQDIIQNESISYKNLIHMLYAAIDLAITAESIGLHPSEVDELQELLAENRPGF